MNRQLDDLLLQRGRLIERIAGQRSALRQDVQPVSAVLERADSVVDKVRAGIGYIRQHPALVDRPARNRPRRARPMAALAGPPRRTAARRARARAGGAPRGSARRHGQARSAAALNCVNWHRAIVSRSGAPSADLGTGRPAALSPPALETISSEAFTGVFQTVPARLGVGGSNPVGAPCALMPGTALVRFLLNRSSRRIQLRIILM